MGQQTSIQWCDATWSPWQGCTKVASGCAHCYMYREKRRYGQDPTVVVRSKPATFNAPLKWPRQDPPLKIFVCSWSDFFHESADPWRAEAWDLMRRTPWHTYLIPTKRPERLRECVPCADGLTAPCPNVWLGLSVSTQDDLDSMASIFFDHLVPAAVRFLSIEPLLGPILLADHIEETDVGDEEHRVWIPGIDWVIVAGESGGPHERRLVRPYSEDGIHTAYVPKPEALAIVRKIRDDCERAEVPFFFKGWGGPRPDGGGRLLDGREWNEFPEGGNHSGRGGRPGICPHPGPGSVGG